jgi:hypothetical protein
LASVSAVICVHAGCSAIIRKSIWIFWFSHFKPFRHFELSIKRLTYLYLMQTNFSKGTLPIPHIPFTA